MNGIFRALQWACSVRHVYVMVVLHVTSRVLDGCRLR